MIAMHLPPVNMPASNLFRDNLMNLIMEQFIKDNGLKRDFVTARVSRSGKMEASTKVTGRTTWQTEEADLFIQTGMYTKANG